MDGSARDWRPPPGDPGGVAIDWNDGRLITLTAGATARCEGLVPGELYAIFFYNSSLLDTDVTVTLVWSNAVPPVKLAVPGTTIDAGRASFAFLSGTDTSFVSASLPPTNETARVDAFLVSVSMPRDPAGLHDRELPADGRWRPFQKLYRYHSSAPSGWHSVLLRSPITQVIGVEMRKTSASLIVLNLASGLASGQPLKLGPTALSEGAVAVVEVTTQLWEDTFFADGSTRVWANGDSRFNSEDAEISLQRLSLFARLRGTARGLLGTMFGRRKKQTASRRVR